MVKYFTLFYDSTTLGNNITGYKIFDKDTFLYKNYEFHGKTDKLFLSDIIELFTYDQSFITFTSAYATGVKKDDEFPDMTLFEFLFDIDPMMDTMKVAIQTDGSFNINPMYKYTNRLYLYNFEEANRVSDWFIQDLYSTNYDGIKNLQVLEQITFSIYLFLVICLGSIITIIKKVNYDVQNKMLFLFTRINKKDIKQFHVTL